MKVDTWVTVHKSADSWIYIDNDNEQTVDISADIWELTVGFAIKFTTDSWVDNSVTSWQLGGQLTTELTIYS